MSFNAGKGYLLGRDIEYQALSPGSLLVGEQAEVRELNIGAENQVLTVVNGTLEWKTVDVPPSSTGQNLGGGDRVLANVTNGHFQFRTLTQGYGVILTENANDIVIELDPQAIALASSTETTLGTPTDGSLTDPIFPGAAGPAFTDWTSMTKVVDAIDDLNEMMGLLLPSQPPALSDTTISMSGGYDTRGGSPVRLASGVTNNTGISVPSAGTQIYRISNTTATLATTPQFGPGTGGDLTSLVNGTVTGTITLARGDDSGTNGDLTIVSDQDYPISNPGFWEALTASISSTVPAGINTYQLNHTVSGSSNTLFFVYDDLNIIPVTSNLTVTEGGSNPPYNYSSGVPHMSGSSILNVSATVNNLSGQTYLGTNVIQISSQNINGASGSLGNLVNINPGTYGIPTIMAVSESAKTVTNVPFTISSSTAVSSVIEVRGRNANTDGAWLTDTYTINALSTVPSNKINELSVPVNEGTVPAGASATAARILLPTGDNPDSSSASSLLVTNWNSTTQVPIYEATVVGGVLQYDTTNYSTGYIPSGPDYSGHSSTQYVTWYFRRSAISSFQIAVSGNYSGLWVTMPGVDFGTAPNGWIDMMQLYAGAGVPGQNGSNGCAVGTAASGSSGTFTCTFGPETSSNATNNIILVRFKLTTNQRITSLSF